MRCEHLGRIGTNGVKCIQPPPADLLYILPPQEIVQYPGGGSMKKRVSKFPEMKQERTGARGGLERQRRER